MPQVEPNFNEIMDSIEEEYFGSENEELDEDEEFEEVALEQETDLCSERTNPDILVEKEVCNDFGEELAIPDENGNWNHILYIQTIIN